MVKLVWSLCAVWCHKSRWPENDDDDGDDDDVITHEDIVRSFPTALFTTEFIYQV